KIHNPQDKTRVMWDLALVMAYIHPEWAEISSVMTPPENAPRQVKVYTTIDATAMEEEFWRLLKSANM
ncbi:hypothetical protein ACWKSR_10145, partial [Campylobacter fetus subsp. venerealis]